MWYDRISNDCLIYMAEYMAQDESSFQRILDVIRLKSNPSRGKKGRKLADQRVLECTKQVLRAQQIPHPKFLFSAKQGMDYFKAHWKTVTVKKYEQNKRFISEPFQILYAFIDAVRVDDLCDMRRLGSFVKQIDQQVNCKEYQKEKKTSPTCVFVYQKKNQGWHHSSWSNSNDEDKGKTVAQKKEFSKRR